MSVVVSTAVSIEYVNSLSIGIGKDTLIYVLEASVNSIQSLFLFGLRKIKV